MSQQAVSPLKVIKIKALLREGWSSAQIATECDVARVTVDDIRNGKGRFSPDGLQPPQRDARDSIEALRGMKHAAGSAWWWRG